MESNDLVLLCGAGLSVSEPSKLKSAVGVANHCYDAYNLVDPIPPHLRDDVDGLAGYFYALGLFEPLFLRKLVPWDDLTGQPNAGHAAVGDFLLTGAAAFALSANFDALIEHWCQSLKVFVQGALDGVEANQFANRSRPLLKFHGCMQRDLERTLWTKAQLPEQRVSDRIESCRDWMAQQLPNRHILVVGFWTDWGYLNEVLGQAIDLSDSASVTVVDTKPTAELEQCAPQLWAVLTAAETFTHVQASADEVLTELRLEFSRIWLRRFYNLGRNMIEAEHGPADPHLFDAGILDVNDIYDVRRDAEGMPSNRAARTKEPPPDAAQSAFAHLLLKRAGAQQQGAMYVYDDRTIRVLNGGGRSLEEVRAKFAGAPSVTSPDLIICAGAENVGVPANVVRAPVGQSIMRPSADPGSHWSTLSDARHELAL